VAIDTGPDDEEIRAGSASPARDAFRAAPVDSPIDGDATVAPGADRTAVFVVPVADGPVATLREIRADGVGRTVRFDGRPMTIGRAPDNTLVLADSRASRHHARIDGRRGTLILSDLGSTNGSWVNDRRVESMALGEGDRIRVGATTLVVEAIGGEPARAADGAAAR
jgi:hypothetical protein